MRVRVGSRAVAPVEIVFIELGRSGAQEFCAVSPVDVRALDAITWYQLTTSRFSLVFQLIGGAAAKSAGAPTLFGLIAQYTVDKRLPNLK